MWIVVMSTALMGMRFKLIGRETIMRIRAR
jgi:hypothetical protein